MSDRKPDGGLDLAQLRTFLAVYRAGSLTAGARLVGLAQPTVTAQLRALEAALDRRLFERLPRGVTPTAVADELAARLAAPMDALEAIASGSGVSAPEPPVHLGGPAEALSLLVLPALAPLLETGVRLRVTTGLADDLLAGLRAGVHDLVLSAVRPRGRAVQATPLVDEEFVLVASPERYARLDRSALTTDPAGAVAGEPLIAYAEDLPILRRYWRHVFGTRLAADPALVVPDLRAVAAAVAAGAGLSVLPRYLCASPLDDGTLVAVLEPEDPPINTVFLARRAGATAHPHVTAVHDALVRAAAEW
ncbi:LysR family transcriptional regulator [Cryptosporangium aurantiacum]|uniref:DNA-binding transcriptional regulator, LysR family n=1 Tax=Cryptosporangium aurantiacum TaxID=134849 RepID=A0A1M7KEZ8_9ACTN|nr:LysR family transcriptional regulator [Cryptosporangium aurantiacum]SHM63408.1 DNA-binding transcriptional regulator, LysR family [Cryptosporangium aurantiacum]